MPRPRGLPAIGLWGRVPAEGPVRRMPDQQKGRAVRFPALPWRRASTVTPLVVR
ncbi:hypothetical protein ABZ835_44960 [Streptomyces sp. NPDC047461]|uniref:hypothetical protein n=1 Tax=Streptomyces sp. NPDC047461 TaxID=3155619 RepID=UPI0033E58FAD